MDEPHCQFGTGAAARAHRAGGHRRAGRWPADARRASSRRVPVAHADADRAEHAAVTCRGKVSCSLARSFARVQAGGRCTTPWRRAGSIEAAATTARNARGRLPRWRDGWNDWRAWPRRSSAS
jgi:hypothetical protein